MEAGALGAEIVISGKLTTERARFEKFRAGYFPRCGEPALVAMRKAEAHVQLKPGIIGVRVKIMPPDAYFPDRIKILDVAPEEEKIIVPEQAAAKPQEQAPPQAETASNAEEAEEEPEVQAKEIADEPKEEAKK
jgi:small subunit ribosomal protein S3